MATGLLRNKYHTLDGLSQRGVKRRLNRSVVAQLLLGIAIGCLLGVVFRFDVESDVAENILRVARGKQNSSRDLPRHSFLRCVIMVDRYASKPASFVSAIAEGYGRGCNATRFYTDSPHVHRTVKDYTLTLIDSMLGVFHWPFYQAVLDHATQVPAQWTLFGDEQLFAIPENLRRMLSTLDSTRPIMVGRVVDSSPFLGWLFPLVSWKRVAVQAGVALTDSAALRLRRGCSSFFLPRSTERALFSCAAELGIQIVDPVDEEGQHLFHEQNIKTLVPVSFSAQLAPSGNTDSAGHKCCSEHAATFGRMSYREQRVAYYALAHISVFGNTGVITVAPTTTTTTTTRKPTTKPPSPKAEKEGEKKPEEKKS